MESAGGVFDMELPTVNERNLELKARIYSDELYDKYLAIAKILTDYSGEIIEQRDVFFRTKDGNRLKIRHLKSPAKSQLIHYDRPDIYGPKLSKYTKIEIDMPETMEQILTSTNGVRGVVEKTRNLFMFGRARIHLDKVKGLGYFLEIEVCLTPDETIEETRAKLDKMIKAFKIQDEHLIMGSYLDELEK